MYVTLNGIERVYQTKNYSVVRNPNALEVGELGELLSSIVDTESVAASTARSQEPNYLVVNTNTEAVEFASDQLPTVIEVTSKLEEALEKVMEEKPKATVSPIRSN